MVRGEMQRSVARRHNVNHSTILGPARRGHPWWLDLYIPRREITDDEKAMTLVVGRATPDIGFLVADTLVSFEYELKGVERLVNGESHVLKIQILNPDTAIAFAGNNVATSLDLITNLDAELRA